MKHAQLQNIQNSINSVEDVRKDKATRKEPEVLLNREELPWAQKATSDWTLLGEEILCFSKQWSSKEELGAESCI